MGSAERGRERNLSNGLNGSVCTLRPFWAALHITLWHTMEGRKARRKDRSAKLTIAPFSSSLCSRNEMPPLQLGCFNEPLEQARIFFFLRRAVAIAARRNNTGHQVKAFTWLSVSEVKKLHFLQILQAGMQDILPSWVGPFSGALYLGRREASEDLNGRACLRDAFCPAAALAFTVGESSCVRRRRRRHQDDRQHDDSAPHSCRCCPHARGDADSDRDRAGERRC